MLMSMDVGRPLCACMRICIVCVMRVHGNVLQGRRRKGQHERACYSKK